MIIDEYTYDKLKKWIRELNLNYEIVNNPNVIFQISVTSTVQGIPPIIIGHKTSDTKYFLFISRINIPEDIQNKILYLSKKDRKDLFWDIKFSLIRLNLDFKIINPELEVPNLWEVSKQVSIDDLTFQKFIDMYNLIKNGILIINWKISRILEIIENNNFSTYSTHTDVPG